MVDVSGLYVTPGLIDAHVHVFATTGTRDAWAGDNSVLPDEFSFRTGVTTMVDAGSSGWRNFEDFRHRVIDRAATRVFAMLNIVGLGMSTDVPEQNVHDMDAKATGEMAVKYRDVVVGIKSAHYQGPEWCPSTAPWKPATPPELSSVLPVKWRGASAAPVRAVAIVDG